jgi:hypothetical protein
MTRIVMTTMALLALCVPDAHAQLSMGSFQGYLTGHVGAITGGDLSEERLSGGASVAVHEDNGWGAEFDLGYASDATAGRQILDVTSYTFNMMWAQPRGVFRPFALVGAGVLQVNGCDSPCNQAARTYDAALNVGGGTFIALHDIAALRADARYFFSSADHPELRRPDNFAYWRATIGVTFMWSITP